MSQRQALRLDSQQVEVIGRSRLIDHLTLGGIEVARPERDKGIDLICYRKESRRRYLMSPVQLKVTRRPTFSVWKKYGHYPGLLMVYVWLPNDADSSIVAMTYREAVQVAQKLEWTKTDSWKGAGHYRSVVSISARKLLTPYEMNPDDWIPLLRRAAPS